MKTVLENVYGWLFMLVIGFVAYSFFAGTVWLSEKLFPVLVVMVPPVVIGALVISGFFAFSEKTVGFAVGVANVSGIFVSFFTGIWSFLFVYHFCGSFVAYFSFMFMGMGQLAVAIVSSFFVGESMTGLQMIASLALAVFLFGGGMALPVIYLKSKFQRKPEDDRKLAA